MVKSAILFLSQQNVNIMRQFRIAFLLLVASLCCSNLYAQTFSIKDKDGNVLFFDVIDAEKKTAEMVSAPKADSVSRVYIKGDLTIPKAVLFKGNYYDVVSLGNNALEGMTEVHSVILPSTLFKISENAFAGCTSLELIQMPDHNIKISKSAFSSCISLNEIIFGKDWTLIDCHPLAECESLETLNIPVNVSTVIGLNELQSLKYIIVDEKNENLSSVDGVLYNKDKTELLYCPRDYRSSLVVPEGVEIIRGGALKNSIWLECIQLPSTLKAFSFVEFASMRNLKELILLMDKPIANASYGGENVFAIKVSGNTFISVPRSAVKSFQSMIKSNDGFYTDLLTGRVTKCNSDSLISSGKVKTLKGKSL